VLFLRQSQAQGFAVGLKRQITCAFVSAAHVYERLTVTAERLVACPVGVVADEGESAVACGSGDNDFPVASNRNGLGEVATAGEVRNDPTVPAKARIESPVGQVADKRVSAG
jgi:hypothetical protein